MARGHRGVPRPRACARQGGARVIAMTARHVRVDHRDRDQWPEVTAEVYTRDTPYPSCVGRLTVYPPCCNVRVPVRRWYLVPCSPFMRPLTPVDGPCLGPDLHAYPRWSRTALPPPFMRGTRVASWPLAALHVIALARVGQPLALPGTLHAYASALDRHVGQPFACGTVTRPLTRGTSRRSLPHQLGWLRGTHF